MNSYQGSLLIDSAQTQSFAHRVNTHVRTLSGGAGPLFGDASRLDRRRLPHHLATRSPGVCTERHPLRLYITPFVGGPLPIIDDPRFRSEPDHPPFKEPYGLTSPRSSQQAAPLPGHPGSRPKTRNVRIDSNDQRRSCRSRAGPVVPRVALSPARPGLQALEHTRLGLCVPTNSSGSEVLRM